MSLDIYLIPTYSFPPSYKPSYLPSYLSTPTHHPTSILQHTILQTSLPTILPLYSYTPSYLYTPTPSYKPAYLLSYLSTPTHHPTSLHPTHYPTSLILPIYHIYLPAILCYLSTYLLSNLPSYLPIIPTYVHSLPFKCLGSPRQFHVFHENSQQFSSVPT